VATPKKTQKKTASSSTKSRQSKKLTSKQYQAVHVDVIRDIERLEADLDLDLKELKRKLHCFCHNPHTA